MIAWLKKNQKQLGVLFLSAICSVAIHYKPEWRDLVLSIGAMLGLVGVHLPPMAYGAKPPPSPPPPSVKPPPLPMFATLPLSILFAVMLIAGVFNCANSKPVAAPNPTAADCIIDRTKAQLDCVREAGTEKQADECIAHVKATQDCTTVDGGR